MPPAGHDEILAAISKLSGDVKLLRHAGWGDVFSQEFDLRNPGTFAIGQFGPGEKLVGVGCSVLEDIEGIPYCDLRVVGSVGNQTTIYYNAPTFNWPIWPFISRGDGSKKGDAFYIPMNICASRHINIEMELTDVATAGKIRFVVIFGFAT